MNGLLKRVVSLAACFVLFVGLLGNYTTNAATLKEEELVNELNWQNAATISLNMTFSGGTITSTGIITGQNGTTAISATFVLARRNANGTFTEVDRWTARNGTNGMILSTSRSTRNLSVGTYRLSTTASVTRNGRVETVTGNHSATFR